MLCIRVTTKWRNNGLKFKTELSRMRKEMLIVSADRLRALTAQSLESVENGLKSKEPTAKEKAALGMDILQVRLTDAVRTVESTNPKAIEQMQFLDEVLYA